MPQKLQPNHLHALALALPTSVVNNRIWPYDTSNRHRTLGMERFRDMSLGSGIW